jgi:hypothetical protein
MRQIYDGLQLLDSAGRPIGTIRQSYLDESGVVQFLDVKLRTVTGRHHLVPADHAETSPDGVRVPYARGVVEESPAVRGDETLTGDELERVRDYYAQEFGEGNVADSAGKLMTAAAAASSREHASS